VTRPDPRKSDDVFSGSYGLGQTHTYVYDDGVLVLPIAAAAPVLPSLGEPPPPMPQPVVVRCHAPMAIRRVDWEARKTGRPPFVPAPPTYSGRDRFLAGGVVVSIPGVLPSRDGWNWQVGGSYLYIQQVPRLFGYDDLDTGGFPFTVGNRLNVRYSLADGEEPFYPGNTMTEVNQLAYLHTRFPSFCFDGGLIG
jgi:hypothetical protein